MTDAEIEKLAGLMKVRIVAELPDVGHGATGAAFMGRFFQLRQGELLDLRTGIGKLQSEPTRREQ